MIQCYLNNAINLRLLTPHIMSCYTYAQNDDSFVTVDSVTSLGPMHSASVFCQYLRCSSERRSSRARCVEFMFAKAAAASAKACKPPMECYSPGRKTSVKFLWTATEICRGKFIASHKSISQHRRDSCTWPATGLVSIQKL